MSPRQPLIHANALIALIAGVVFASASASAQVAPDVVVLCDPAVWHAVSDVGDHWEQQTGVPVHVIASPTPLLIQQISHKIRSDFVIAEGDAAEAMATQQHSINPETRFGGWRNRLVLAQLSSGSKAFPNPSSGNIRALVGAGPVAVVDLGGTTVGDDSEKALGAAGLSDIARKHAVGVAGTADAAFLLAHDKVKSAIIYKTDVVSNDGFSAAASFADDSYPPITYWIAQTSAAVSPQAAKFGQFLQRPQAQQLLRADGLEISP